MATEPMNEEPAIEDEALKPVTTLALPPEEAMSTTISLETKRVALEFWTARRDLHTDKNSKASRGAISAVLVGGQGAEGGVTLPVHSLQGRRPTSDFTPLLARNSLRPSRTKRSLSRAQESCPLKYIYNTY